MNESHFLGSEKHVTSAPRIIACVGTRPEVVKMAPVVKALRERGVEVWEYFSGQSNDLVTERSDLPYIVCKTNGSWGKGMHEGIAKVMRKFKHTLDSIAPDAVIVQGDTATAFACAQAAFLARVPVAHVEAGMRTYASEPWPEEAFRRQIAAVARWHFAPDADAARNVAREMGMTLTIDPAREKRGIYAVGNTVIDTLPRKPFRVLVTLHRRENWGKRIKDALMRLAEFACSNPKVEIACVRHPNWDAQEIKTEGHQYPFVDFVAPMPREELLERMQSVDVVVTDSGGLQEEAAHFGIPCLVLRTSTERVALERTGAVILVHPDDPNALQRELEALLAKRRCYGDGTASAQIAEILVRELATLDTPR